MEVALLIYSSFITSPKIIFLRGFLIEVNNIFLKGTLYYSSGILVERKRTNLTTL